MFTFLAAIVDSIFDCLFIPIKCFTISHSLLVGLFYHYIVEVVTAFLVSVFILTSCVCIGAHSYMILVLLCSLHFIFFVGLLLECCI